MKNGLDLKAILATIHPYATVPEANRSVASERRNVLSKRAVYIWAISGVSAAMNKSILRMHHMKFCSVITNKVGVWSIKSNLYATLYYISDNL